MRKILLLNTLLVATFIFSSCGTNSSKNNEEQINIVDSTLLGTYVGVLPCADCAGIETTVFLDANSSYSKISKYLATKETEIKENGEFKYCKKKNILTLISTKNDTTYFGVENNQIILLDADGKKSEGELAKNYILNKK